MDVANEILDAIEIIVDKKIRENTAQIYPGVCKSVSGNTCVVSINGKDNTVRFYGSTPSVDSIYRVFVPNGNMSMAFIITGGGSGGGSSSSGVTSYKKLTDLPSINGVILQEGATSKSLNLYGTGNEPNYPVTKVNGKTGEVILTADDVDALPSDTTIPTKTSELTNDSGFITLTQVPDSPVQSVNGKTGDVVLTATDVNALPSSTTIPTKTSQLTNDSEFITLAQVPTAPVQSVNGQTGAVVIDEYSLPTASDTVLGGIKVGSGLTINSDGVLSATGGGVADAVEWDNVQSKPTTISGYGITDAKIDNGAIILGDNTITPVTSVNGQTGSVNLTASDVDAAPSSHSHTKSQITDFPTSMTPTAHASTHASGGSDPITPSSIGAQPTLTTNSTVSIDSINNETANNHHCIILGKSGRDKVDFHEYGGIYNFYRTRTSANENLLMCSINNPDAVTNASLRNISAGTTDLIAGSSALATGSIYFVYE